MADDGAGDRASEEEGEIDEGIVGAESGAAIFDGDVTDGFDGERGEHQGKTDADEGRGDKRGRGNARETQQEEAEDFNEKRNDGDRKAAESRDQTDKEQAGHDEASSIDGQGQGGAAPLHASEVKRNECCENAETNAAEGEHGAVGSDAPKDVREGQMPGRRDGNARQTESQRERSQRYAKDDDASGSKAPMLLKQNAERGAYGEGGECGDAIPGDDFGYVFGAGAPEAPHGGAGADHAFADAEQEASQEKNKQADEREGVEESGGKGEGAACCTCEKAEHCDALGTEDVHHAANARARENGGDILRADDQSRENGAVTELQANAYWEDGERDADGQVADEGEGDGRKDSRNDATRRL